MNKDYAGIPFAVGTVTGARSWTVDTMGRLVGNYDQIWRPGENVARCPAECEGIEEKCTCGFYGYHRHENVSGDAMGVIEGYGTVVVGTSGFRCSKARVIGLYLASWAPRVLVARNYPDIPLVDKPKHAWRLLRHDGIPTPDAMGDEFWTLGAKPLTKPNQGGMVMFGPPNAASYFSSAMYQIAPTISWQFDEPKKNVPALEYAPDEDGDDA